MSHAPTDPLLSPAMFKEETFTAVWWRPIIGTATLADLAASSLPAAARSIRVSMEQQAYGLAA